MPELEFVGVGLARDASPLVPPHGNPVQPEFVRTIARAHARAGFDRVLVGETSSSPDAVGVAGAILAATDRLGVLVTIRPAAQAPTAAARALATIDAFHPGRVALHLPDVASDLEPRRDGDWSDRGERQRRRAEFAGVVLRAWTADRPFDHDGEFYRIAGSWSPLRPATAPPVYVSGASPASDELAANFGNVYLLPTEAPDAVALRIAMVTTAASELGRSVRFGLSLRPILGDTESAAQAYAERVLRVRAGIDLPRAAALREATGALDGIGPLVGTPLRVSTTIRRYRDLGISVFHLSGYRPLDDVAAFGKLIACVREPAAAQPMTA